MATDECMNLLRLLRRGGAAGADGPLRFIPDHRTGKAFDAAPVQHGVELGGNHVLGLSAVALVESLADTQHWCQPCRLRRGKLDRHDVIGFAMVLTAL